jgi:chromosome segregation ATPase
MAEEGLDKVLQDLDLAPTEYEALERDFQLMLQEMQGDQTLEKFRQDYEKLHRTLKRSHEIEKRLIKKCKDLNRDIQVNARNVAEALKMAQKDSEEIKKLKNEVEQAWKLVDHHNEMEQRSKQTIQNLKQELHKLGKIVEQGAGIAVDQKTTINDLMEEKKNLLKEREAQHATYTKLQSDNAVLYERLQKLETEVTHLESEKRNIKEIIANSKSNADREERRRKRLESEMEQAKKKRGELEAEVAKREKINEEAEEELRKKRSDLEVLKQNVMALSQSIQECREETKKLETQQKNEAELNKKLEQRKRDNLSVLQDLEHDILGLRQDNQSLTRDIIRMKRNNKALSDVITDANLQKDVAKQNIHNLGKVIEVSKRQAEEDRKVITSLEEDLKKMEESVRNVEEDTKKKQEEITEKAKTEETLRREIKEKEEDAAKQYQDIIRLSKIKEKFGIEASQANAKYMQCLEEVKLKNNLIAELQKKNLESEAKLKQQQNLCEAVRSDRNLYSKNLIESQDMIAELRRNFKIYHHQIEQLKEDIESKSKTLAEKQSNATKIESENEGIKLNKEKIEKNIGELKNRKMNLINEAIKLKEIIVAADNERIAQKEQYEKIINQRDLLGTQLIRKNDELALLYEKIKIQQSALAKGEVMYQERIVDIRLIKFKIADLNRELSIANRLAAQIEDLKQQVFLLEEELLQERTKVKALSEELENSMNTNRYQELEGKDPPEFELLSKVETLQHRLISKTEQVVEFDVLIQEKEKLLMELGEVIEKQPGVDVARELGFYSQRLRETTRKMKSIASELNMFHSQVNEYKDEIERQTKELQEYKRKYYEKKRAERENN